MKNALHILGLSLGLAAISCTLGFLDDIWLSNDWILYVIYFLTTLFFFKLYYRILFDKNIFYIFVSILFYVFYIFVAIFLEWSYWEKNFIFQVGILILNLGFAHVYTKTFGSVFIRKIIPVLSLIVVLSINIYYTPIIFPLRYPDQIHYMTINENIKLDKSYALKYLKNSRYGKNIHNLNDDFKFYNVGKTFSFYNTNDVKVYEYTLETTEDFTRLIITYGFTFPWEKNGYRVASNLIEYQPE
jgi:hypothetical protein